MSLRQEYGKLLRLLFPAGAAGISLLLGASPPAEANVAPASRPGASVAERLEAIRGAVTDLAGPAVKPEAAETQLAWGNWRNGGWRNGGWRNGGCRNVGWHNGGWGNVGWHNGGWRNDWHNWWRNW